MPGKLLDKLKWLDPFTYVDLYVMPKVNPGKRESISFVVYVVFAFLFAFIIFNALGLLLGTSSPMVIVVSDSMEPVLFRGDVVILGRAIPAELRAQEVSVDLALLDALPLEQYAVPYCTVNNVSSKIVCKSLPRSCPANYNTSSIKFGDFSLPVTTQGDIVVYNSNTLGDPIIHRVVAKINARDGIYVLTKGDNVCNANIDQEVGINRGAIKASELQGKALFWIPKIGCIKLWVFDDLFSLVFSGKLPRNFSGIC